MFSVHQRHRQTDGQTVGRTTYDSNTALALRASRGKNYRVLDLEYKARALLSSSRLELLEYSEQPYL